MAALRKSVEWPSRVGDAVMRFLGDSSQLDSKFAEVKPIAERAFALVAELEATNGFRKLAWP
jgi:hypothetical protein